MSLSSALGFQGNQSIDCTYTRHRASAIKLCRDLLVPTQIFDFHMLSTLDSYIQPRSQAPATSIYMYRQSRAVCSILSIAIWILLVCVINSYMYTTRSQCVLTVVVFQQYTVSLPVIYQGTPTTDGDCFQGSGASGPTITCTCELW